MPCPLCDDTGWKSIEVDGVSRVTRCDCIRDRTLEQRLRDARIPPRYQKCTLDNFLTYPNEELLRAVEYARRFTAAFPVVQKGLMLIGPPGIGKTHIAVSVLRQVVGIGGARGLYYDTRALLKDIRSTYNPLTHTAEMDVIRPVMEAELLVLDDLGAELGGNQVPGHPGAGPLAVAAGVLVAGGAWQCAPLRCLRGRPDRHVPVERLRPGRCRRAPQDENAEHRGQGHSASGEEGSHPHSPSVRRTMANSGPSQAEGNASRRLPAAAARPKQF